MVTVQPCRKGIGSTFSFELYLEKGEAAADISEETSELVNLNGKRILLAEDVDRALAVGMNGHLSKPIEMDVMMKLLQKHGKSLRL